MKEREGERKRRGGRGEKREGDERKGEGRKGKYRNTLPSISMYAPAWEMPWGESRGWNVQMPSYQAFHVRLITIADWVRWPGRPAIIIKLVLPPSPRSNVGVLLIDIAFYDFAVFAHFKSSSTRIWFTFIPSDLLQKTLIWVIWATFWPGTISALFGLPFAHLHYFGNNYKKLIRRWDSERELSLWRSCTRTRKCNRLA